ncbi:MAG: hypothetical protein GY701_02740 [Sulfitobacter sp.]|nr:hypothetical protein [Sulfitobacter sp.]
MSQLQQLKSQLNGIASDAKTTAGGLSGFKSKFSSAVGQVQSTIGGSAQRTDQQIIQTLRAAEKQVEAAVAALQQAASAAQGYASSL